MNNEKKPPGSLLEKTRFLKKSQVGPDALENAPTSQTKNTGQLDQAEKFQEDFVQKSRETPVSVG